ncbi:MAG TPA: GNAT family N-acetyltransferase [Gemmataceae bacterium]|nr:GNAT family N-acetyltransferase [Gemmataceae bacterium]
MTDAPLTVRRMAPGEVGLIRDWADAEGWNPGTHDGPAFFAADPDGFFVGELAGEPVGCVSCVRYGERFGFLGQYIVRPAHRGRACGIALGKAGLAYLAGRCIGLDGVLDKVGSYERIGFRFAHYTALFVGTGGGSRPAGLVPLGAVPFEKVAEFDARCFPAPREAFLRAWFALPESVGLVAVEGGRLAGYGVLRRSANGHKVGPLFATDAEPATRLLAGLVATIPGGPFCIDIPDDTVQPHGARLVEAFGLTEVFRTARMYTTAPPPHDSTQVFGVTSLELG